MSDAAASLPAAVLARADLDDLKGGFNRVALVALAVFTAWSILVPLDSAVVAPGTVTSSGLNKVLQSRTGGTVAAIHARDGQRLKKGQPILEIDAIADRAELTRLMARRATLTAMKSRLDAEKTAASDPALASSAPAATALFQPLNAEVIEQPAAAGGEDLRAQRELNDEQRREFEKGRGAIAGEIAAAEQRAEALKRKREGLSQRLPLLSRQLELLEKQLQSARKLAEGGHIASQQVWEIESRAIDRRGEVVNATAELQATEAQIKEIEGQLAQIKDKDARTTSQQLTDVLGELNQITDQLRAAETQIAEKSISAPEAGTLVRWTVTTVGAVVRPGDVIGEIVPESAALEVQARVAPTDISAIHPGQRARVKISAFAGAESAPIDGEVTIVAADSSLDERTQERYFDVRVRLAQSAGHKEISVGMTGEVYLLGEPRTFASYLFGPITQSFGKAFGER